MHCGLKNVSDAPKFYSISDVEGTIEIFDKYLDGLNCLDEHEYIVVIFHFHLSKGYDLMQRRNAEDRLKGVFSLCSPMRPNPIGMSILKLIDIKAPLIYVRNVDMINDTPILDIKPYKPVAPRDNNSSGI